MTPRGLLLLVALLAVLSLATELDFNEVPHSDSSPDTDEPIGRSAAATTVEDEGDSDGSASGVVTDRNIFAVTLFLEQLLEMKPRLYAGERSQVVVAISADPTAPGNHEVLLAFGTLSRLDHVTQIQNYSSVRYDREVAPGETIALRYSLTPSPFLEPQDYELAIRVIFRDSNNRTMIISAFNSTVTIEESRATDPKTIATFVVLAVACGGAMYWFAQRRKRAIRPAAASRLVESAAGTQYDPDFVSDEHKKYIDELLKKSQQRQSPSPTKKAK